MSRSKLLSTLVDMHTYARPHGGKSDRAFRARYLLTLPGAREDRHGNIRIKVDDSPILWSAHTDTVSRFDGMQRVSLSADGTLSLASGKKNRRALASGVLGADDTAGCFVLREMILRGVPGSYVFHYGEERGGIGSRAMARHEEKYLRAFQCAIALDRRGTSDVITHQMGMRCASDLFALSLADILNTQPVHFYRPSDRGIYTDTAEYADIIPECSNIAIGYEHAHSAAETLDSAHVLRVLDALSETTIEKLTIARDPNAWTFDYREDERASTPKDDPYIIDGIDWRTFLDEPVRPTRDDRSLYLSDDYADVQRALKRAQRETRIRSTWTLTTKGKH
jgi:hypothetical protein